MENSKVAAAMPTKPAAYIWIDQPLESAINTCMNTNPVRM